MFALFLLQDYLLNWAGYTRQEALIGYIKLILSKCRTEEVRAVGSAYAYHAREKLLFPERLVSRRKSAPSLVGWLAAYAPLEENCFAVDCEFVSYIIGRKNNGKLRCKNVVGTVSVVDWNGSVVYNKIVYHDPTKVYLTPEMKRITGFDRNFFVNGEQLPTVQSELKELLMDKLVIFHGAGGDLSALEFARWDFCSEGGDGSNIFDLQEYFRDEKGPIKLQHLVMSKYGINIQESKHSADTDAVYTMKLFRDFYVPDKIASEDEAYDRGTKKQFSELRVTVPVAAPKTN